MAYLYAGKILFIDLSKKTIKTEPTRPYAKLFLGGRGINIKLLYDNIVPGSDALGPDNVLVFGVGPLGGTSISTGRTEVTAKSPETGFLGSSNFGGYFAGELKYAGYDHIVVTGKADKPVYLWIENENIAIKDASPAWGKDAYEAPEIIRQDIDNPDAKIACIGPAGENLVRFASIQHGLGHSAGRTGLGAVMGSKNLKAIAVRGTNGIKLAEPEKFMEVSAELERQIREDEELTKWSKEGLSSTMDDMSLGQGEWADYFPNFHHPTTGPSMHAIYKKHLSKRAGCFGCPVQCMDHYQVEGIGTGVISCQLYVSFTKSVECYDTDTSLGCALLSQRYGIDCNTTGEIIHWLMELYEIGVITEKDMDGLSMGWGNPNSIRGMLEKITYRDGIGDVLAEGILSAAEKIGRGSVDYANQVKGIPIFEGATHKWLPYFKGGALSTVIGSRGDQMRAYVATTEVQYLEHEKTPDEFAEVIRPLVKDIAGTEKALDPGDYEGKPEMVCFYENITALCDMLSTCKYLSLWGGFLPFTPEFQSQLLSTGSGVKTSIEDLFVFAEKVRTMERVFDVGGGLTRECEILPKRFFDNPVPDGDLKGAVLEPDQFEEMKNRYYALKGWDPATGIPTEDRLRELGLGDVAEYLKRQGKLPKDI